LDRAGFPNQRFHQTTFSNCQQALERAYGKSQQAIELSGKDGSPIQTVTQTMTPQEAAAAYANTLANG
jgi:hypothetical protein